MAAAVTAALLSTGVGAAVVVWHLGPVWALAGGLVLSAFSGHWRELGLPAFIAPDRLLLLLAIVACVAEARRQRPALPPPWRRPAVALLGAAALWAIGSAVAADTLVSGGYRLLDRFGLVAFALFAVTPGAWRDARDRTVLLGAMTVLGAYLSLTAVCEIVGPRALVFPAYIADPSVGIHFGRARGPFLEAATNGMALFACGAAAVLLTLQVPGRVRRIGCALVVVLCAAGILLTLQRTAWIATVAGVIAAGAVEPRGRRLLLPALAGLALVALTMLATVPGLAERAQARRDNQLTIWDRTNLAHAAVAMTRAEPLTGVGWNRFQATSAEFFWQSDIPLTAGDAIPHNAVLADSAEIGIPGALLWVAGIAAAVATALRGRIAAELRPWRAALVALSVFVVALAAFTPLLQPFPLLVLMTWAAVLVGAGRSEARP